MSKGIMERFRDYCEVVIKALKHADREQPASWYLKGLMLPGGRKSIEPMAARVHPENVRSAHQSMHHLVADAGWSDEALLGAVAGEVLPALLKNDAPCVWIVDDTGFPKKGECSVGVARQYCGQLGKTDNCQVAVSLSVATEAGSLPLAYRLYLPEEWAEDKVRRSSVYVPSEITFATKGEIALSQIEATLAAEVRHGVLLADAAYGDETAFRDRLTELGLTYAVGVRPGTTVWWGDYQPAPMPDHSGRGRPRERLVRDADHQPISVLGVARALSPQSYRTITWRIGEAGELTSRFARVRVRPAHRDKPRAEEWLLIEWPKSEDEPTRYWFSTLPRDISFDDLVATVKGRWMIERDYQNLKQEVGLGHFEGRSWGGFHHHASLCIAAYGFLILERLRHPGKKNSTQLKEPAVSKGFRPRGRPTRAAARTLVNRHNALSSSACNCSNSVIVPVLCCAQR